MGGNIGESLVDLSVGGKSACAKGLDDAVEAELKKQYYSMIFPLERGAQYLAVHISSERLSVSGVYHSVG